MHIHTILLENPSKVKKFLLNKSTGFLKKTKIPKIAVNPHKIRLKLNRNEKDLSNFSINCQTNFVDVWRDSL
mgnify:FL=1|jgi:hypothetical protein